MRRFLKSDAVTEGEKDQNTACGGCIMRERCTVQDETKYSCRQRWKALFIAYILPFVLLAGAIVVTDRLTDNEYLIGGVALGIVALYYLILFINKPKV